MNLHHINTIARYEVKLLKRSWLFRIFAILALLAISLLVLTWQTALTNPFEYRWPRIALTSLMPFTSIVFYNIAQSVIVVFLAGSFLKRDKKLDTAEVIYVRPMSNADYIIGKTWGIIKVFLSLNIITLSITAFFNLTLNHSPFSLFPYIFYLLTISFPSLLFVLGLSFTVMCLLKNQAVTFIVMLGIIGTVFFELSGRLYGVFDFFGTKIPAIFSDVTGHADLRLFLLQRTIYLLAGIGLICFTITLVKRLPHKPWKTIIVNTLGGIFLFVSCIAGTLYILHYRHQLSQRNNYALTFNQYAPGKKVSIVTHDLTVTPGDQYLAGKSILQVVNKHPETLEQLFFYLNPALEVKSVQVNNQPVNFTRDNQVIVINTPLESHQELALTLEYAGKIDEAICYTDVNEKEYLDNSIPQVPYQFGKRYAWLEDKFTLLTPECLWYPVAVPPVNPAEPYNIRKNFTTYTLTVHHPGHQTVLSQGNRQEENGKTIFTHQHPLPGISLTLADYEKKALKVDSVEYEIYYFKGHDYFSAYFNLLQDTLPALIRDIKNDIEIAKGRDYPFSKFVLAETPVQFASYIRNWKGYTEYVMPEILFIPERGATLKADFAAEEARGREWRRRDQGMPDKKELAENSLRNFIALIFLNETIQSDWFGNEKKVNPTNIAPLFFTHTSFVYSEDYPVIDIVLNTMQNTSSSTNIRPWGGGIINDEQRANLYLESNSFKTALSDQEIKPEIFYELLKLKSKALRNYIHTQMPPEVFQNFLKTFFKENNFTDISFETFQQELEKQSGTDLRHFIRVWYTEDHSPALFIKDVDANQVVVDEITKYQIKFKVNNPSDVDGIITAEIQQGGDFRGGRRRGGGPFNMNTSQENPETYIIPAKQAREIKIIVDERPGNIKINTNISNNLPTLHTSYFPKIDNTVTDTVAGTFPISPDIFKPNPNEIIVDNEDSHFRTIASNNRHKLKDLFQKKDEEKYKNFYPWLLPSKWTVIAADYCYGETVNSAVIKRKGSGNNSVEWTADIPKNGYYEVSVWNAKQGMFGMRRPGRYREREERNQTYNIQYGEENKAITLDLEQEDGGWVTLGNFYLSQGPVTITLTDKGTGSYIIADAVKFTFANE